jgi:hypothetical protein
LSAIRSVWAPSFNPKLWAARLLVSHASITLPIRCHPSSADTVPKDTLVLTTYRCADVVNEHDPEIHAVITETATGNKIVDQGLAKTGKLVFTSHIGGEHQICFNVISKSFFGSSSKVHVR